ncbi:hypothetical protein CEXT_164391 [Caerostris extrusa]|uniref:Uncharacterized protein n=1 Tax=Caerostris extrusa TaxID=172846 RepID=A0AAV4RGQ5_CAEEX|nr:hypothetical protein CEXT_164391 [Caerostris extrusa]
MVKPHNFLGGPSTSVDNWPYAWRKEGRHPGESHGALPAGLCRRSSSARGYCPLGPQLLTPSKLGARPQFCPFATPFVGRIGFKVLELKCIRVPTICQSLCTF